MRLPGYSIGGFAPGRAVGQLRRLDHQLLASRYFLDRLDEALSLVLVEPGIEIYGIDPSCGQLMKIAGCWSATVSMTIFVFVFKAVALQKGEIPDVVGREFFHLIQRQVIDLLIANLCAGLPLMAIKIGSSGRRFSIRHAPDAPPAKIFQW